MLRIVRGGGLSVQFRRWAIREIWLVAFSGVENCEASSSADVEKLLRWRNRCLYSFQVASLDFTKAIG
jgi:hypothetical protein